MRETDMIFSEIQQLEDFSCRQSVPNRMVNSTSREGKEWKAVTSGIERKGPPKGLELQGLLLSKMRMS